MRCLRCVLMKPEHEAWLDGIWERLSEATHRGSGQVRMAEAGWWAKRKRCHGGCSEFGGD